MIEDITETQALSSLRKFYTDDAGYALARQIDTDLMDLGKSLGNGNGSSWVAQCFFPSSSRRWFGSLRIDRRC